LGLEKYVNLVVERLRDSIHPDDSAGEAPLLPIPNRYRPWLSTGGVDFVTTCSVYPTTKSQINAVVQHSDWERTAAQILENNPVVKCYAKNERLDFKVKYEYMGVENSYEPDFLVRLANGITLIIEIKGYEVQNLDQLNQKHNAAKKWVTAVNNLADFGKWDFMVCRDLGKLAQELEKFASQPTTAKVATV
jgi:type III restriction enzyme